MAAYCEPVGEAPANDERGLPRVPLVATRLRTPVVLLIALLTLGSGLVNLYSLLQPGLANRIHVLRAIFPLSFLEFSRLVTLLSGFGLVVSAINIYKCKARAFKIVLSLAAASVVFHLTKGIDYEEALLSLALVVLLIASRSHFIVRSRRPDWRSALSRLAIAVLLTVGYSTLGFWMLDAREFGLAFSFHDAFRRTLLLLSLSGDPGLVPHTRYASWFLHSISSITVLAVVYSGWNLFRPIAHRLRSVPQERTHAQQILSAHGRSSLDYFKVAPDKSFFFSTSRRCFLAYRVSGAFAVGLGDPVGPAGEIAAIVSEFTDFCTENDWGFSLYQTLPDFLPVYRQLGLKKIKLGDDAIVTLSKLDLKGRANKALRSSMNKIARLGLETVWHDPPLSQDLLDQLCAVTSSWRRLPGRRERQFSLGRFDPEYVRNTPVFVAVDGEGSVLAFVNIIPSHRRDEATIDLMRRCANAPNGVMDYLLVKLFEREKEEGFERFNLGMAPMSGFADREHASAEERAIHFFLQRLKFVFSYRGLRAYKAKFATEWEPRYLVYRTELDLPRLAVALARVSESTT